MERLLRALAEASAGRPGVVLVKGEAGIGKSRLIVESLGQPARPAGLLVLTGRCVEVAGADLPYAPFAAAIRDLVRQVGIEAVRGLSGPAMGALSVLIPALAEGDPPDGSASRASILDAVTAVLTRLAGQRPVVLVVEDLHWSDASTRDLLGYLARTLTDERLLIVVTLRDEGAWDPALTRFVAELLRVSHVDQVTLSPLDPEQVSAQAADIAGRPLAADHVTRLVELSDGLPFLVEELLAAEPEWTERVPERARQIVLARLIGLSGQTRRLIEAASLADAELTDELLRTVMADTDIAVDDALHAAIDAAVLVVDEVRDGYRFRHALLRAAVAQAMLPGERRAWHRRWAEALELEPRFVDPLQAAVAAAHHWQESGDPDRALVTTLNAAEACRHRSAYTEQAALMQRALALWDRATKPEALTGRVRAQLVDDTETALGGALATDERIELLEAELRRADLATSPVRRANLRLQLIMARREQGGASETADMDELINIVSASPPDRDKVRALQELTWFFNWTDPDKAKGFIAEAVSTAEATGDSQFILAAKVDRAGHRTFVGEQDQAWLEFVDLMPHLDLMDPVRAGLAQQGMVAATFDLGRLQESAALSEASMQRLGSPESAPGAWAAIAACYTHALVGLGRWERASEVVDGALRVPVVVRQPGYRTWLNSWKGLLAVWRGDIDTAEFVAADTEAIFGTTGFEEWTGVVWLRGELAAATHEPLQVREALAPVWSRPELATLSETVVWYSSSPRGPRPTLRPQRAPYATITRWRLLPEQWISCVLSPTRSTTQAQSVRPAGHTFWPSCQDGPVAPTRRRGARLSTPGRPSAFRMSKAGHTYAWPNYTPNATIMPRPRKKPGSQPPSPNTSARSSLPPRPSL